MNQQTHHPQDKNKKRTASVVSCLKHLKLALALPFLLLLTILFIGGNNVYAVITDTFIANYTNNYTVSHTSSSYINNVSYYNATWLDFSGIGNITLPYTSDFTNEITYFITFKKIEGGTQPLISYLGTLLRITDTQITYFNNISGSGYSLTTTLNNNTIYTLSVIANNTHQFKILNGSLVQDNDVATGLNVTPLRNYIGKYDGTYFNGSIYEVRVYNKTLLPYQAMILSNESKTVLNLGQRVTQLMYHSVGQSDVFSLDIDTGNFTEQMNYINSSGGCTITLANYYDWSVNNNFSMPCRNAYIIVFDDGLKNTLTNASVIMDNYGFKGVTAIITKNIGLSSRLSASDVATLVSKGWEIASHSQNHTTFLDLDYSTRINEFNYSKINISTFYGLTARSFVFPFNGQNSSIISECKQFYNVCTGTEYTPTTAQYAYKSTNISTIGFPRIGIYNTTTIIDFKRINLEDSIIMNFRLTENSGAVAYDTSGKNNNGNIKGDVAWKNDTNKLNLIATYDYKLSSNQFQLVNPNLDKTYMELDYSCVYPFNNTPISFNTQICQNTKNPYVSITSTRILINTSVNYLVNLTNLTAINSYNDIFVNGNKSFSNVDSANWTAYPNNVSIALSYPDERKWISSIDSTVQDVTYTQTTKKLIISCTGSGVVSLTYLANLFSNQQYNVFHNGKYITSTDSNTYTTDGTCSDWEFSQRQLTMSEASPVADTINKVATASLLAIFIILISGLPAYRNYNEWTLNQWFTWMIYTLVVILFGIVVMQNIFTI